MRRAARAILALSLFLGSACSVELSRSESGDIVRNKCTSNSDCEPFGTCWSGGVCVANQGTLKSLLFEVTPPTTAPLPGIGGVRFLKMHDELSLSSEQHLVNLEVASTVHGYFSSPCQFEATLTPEEQSYGLPAVKYVGRTVPAQAGTCPQGKTSGTQEFVVNLPQGKYSVYLRPTSDLVGMGDAGVATCDAVPVALGLEAKPGISCVPLAIPQTQTLEVQLPWSATSQRLDGWTVDIVHPITGQTLSLRHRLGGKLQTLDDGSSGYRIQVDYSPAVAAGAMNAKQELLRLAPPSPGDGPVVQLSLLGLVNSSPVPASGRGVQKAILPPNMGPFPKKVHVEGSVYDAIEYEVAKELPVPSTLTFTATKLDGLPDGVPASFATSSVVKKDGKIAVDLLPGVYRVRLVPTVDQVSEVRWAVQETTWPVRASDGATQAGHVIGVLRAATITGSASSVLGGPLDGVAVDALPGSAGMRRCEDRDASTCASQPISALDVALAEDAFVPRSAAAVTGRGGGFVVQDVDCGDCSRSGAGALYDVTVRPADGSRLPWIVQPGVVVASSDEYGLHELQTTFPIIQRGTVQLLQEAAADLLTPGADRPIPLPGTLIRAYLLRDASGSAIFDPSGLSSCATGTYSGTETGDRCIRSALLVAETFAGADGKYELVLPAGIDGAATR